MLRGMTEPAIRLVTPELLAVDKPAGMPTHALDAAERSTLVDWVGARFPDVPGVRGDGRHGGLLHRLDTETSGLLLFARNDAAYAGLWARMRAGEVLKTYLAFVRGPWQGQGVVELPVAHHQKSRRRMLAVAPGMRHFRGKPRPARTTYRVLEVRGDFALVEAVITKGARHQVRVHLAALGHPIVGDLLYDPRARTRPLPRHCLHATALAFTDLSGVPVSVAAELPEELASWWGEI